MELKPTLAAGSDVSIVAFNQTKMELKRSKSDKKIWLQSAFNQTKMELKLLNKFLEVHNLAFF